MSKCPYTWVRGLFSPHGSKPRADGEPASQLVVRVVRDGDERVRVSLPARGARVLMDLIPSDVLARIREEQIPIDDMMLELRNEPVLLCRQIFTLREAHREVDVWLE